MIKKIFNIVIYSTILFCVFSFLSILISIISNKINHSFPNFKIGFPLNYYYQFEIRNNFNGHDLLHGTNPKNFILNYLICLFIIVFLNRF